MSASDPDRTAKLLVDAKHSPSFEEAARLLQTFSASLFVDPECAREAAVQAAVLTAVNCGARSLRGGIEVVIDPSTTLAFPWAGTSLLAEAIRMLGGTISQRRRLGGGVISIGQQISDSGFGVQIGVRGSIVTVDPLHHTATTSISTFTPSGVLAGSIAISEVFHRFLGLERACRRHFKHDLLEQDGAVLPVKDALLPSEFWFLGLGHLGQAYCWTTSLLPFRRRNEVNILLQDFDYACSGNLATSILTTRPDVEASNKKTRLCSAWLEDRGFCTTITERRFDGNTRRVNGEPMVTLGGFDSPVPRRLLERAGFGFIVDGGIGDSYEDYAAFRLYTFPGPKTAENIFGRDPAFRHPSSHLADLPEYTKRGTCGAMELAGVPVGTSFVGSAASALVISELIKRSSGFPFASIIDGNLRSLHPFRSADNATAQPAVLRCESRA